MPELQAFPLITRSGIKGRVFRASRFLDRSNVNRIQLDDGTDTTVLASALHIQADGSFLLDDGAIGHDSDHAYAAAEVPPAEAPSIEYDSVPVHADSAPVAETAAVRNVPVDVTASAREIQFDEPLFVEDVQVERVPINRIIDGPAQTRQEGDTTIVPVVEEVITVQKRLLLREEVRITRRRTEVRKPRTVRMEREDTRIIGSDGRDIDSH